MPSTLRLVFGAILVAASATAQAVYTPDHIVCGSGTIEELIEGAWSAEGIHLTMNWDGGSPIGVLPSGRSSTAIVLASDVGPERMKVLRAAAWLAFANDFQVKLVTGRKTEAGEVDCGRVREIHMSK